MILRSGRNSQKLETDIPFWEEFERLDYLENGKKYSNTDDRVWDASSRRNCEESAKFSLQTIGAHKFFALFCFLFNHWNDIVNWQYGRWSGIGWLERILFHTLEGHWRIFN